MPLLPSHIMYIPNLVLCTCDFLPLASLQYLSQCSRQHRELVQKFLSGLVRRHIHPFAPDIDGFFNELRATQAIVGGDIALNVALFGQNVRSITQITLAIYIPRGMSSPLKTFLGRQGYSVRPRKLVPGGGIKGELDADLEPDEWDARTSGYLSTTRLVNSSGYRIILVESETQCASYPIMWTYTTARFVAITPSTICIAYPRLTFEKVTISHFRAISHSDSARIDSMALVARGFQVKNWHVKSVVDESLFEVIQGPRSFFDAQSCTIRFSRECEVDDQEQPQWNWSKGHGPAA